MLISPSPSTDASFDAGSGGDDDVLAGGGGDRLFLFDLLDFLELVLSCAAGAFLPEESSLFADGPKLVVQATMSSNLLTCAVALCSS